MATSALLLFQVQLLVLVPCWSLPFGPFFYFNPPHMSGVLDHRGNINNVGLFDMRSLQQLPNQHEPSPLLLNYDTNPRSLALQRRAQNEVLQNVWFAPYYNRPLYEEIRDMEQ